MKSSKLQTFQTIVLRFPRLWDFTANNEPVIGWHDYYSLLVFPVVPVDPLPVLRAAL